jgi:acetyl-CoA synthetase (ADP-forming)
VSSVPATTDLLRAVINPRAGAVIGASSDTAKFGGRVMRFLVQHGFGGTIIPVNPSASPVLGIPAYQSPIEARTAIDVALLAVPSQYLPRALEDCGIAGVRCCVIITADFAEAGEEGAAREAELVTIARRYQMRLIGPNCLGFVNPPLKLALTSSVALAIQPMPTGSIGLVSQSGSMMASMISHAADSGAGFSACITVGNQADLETCDFIEYFLHDEKTLAICAYIEGLKDARRFLALAERCRAVRKPLLVVKAGSSRAGVEIARSHTASLAGSHAVWSAAARDAGVLTVDDPESMIACAHFLTRFNTPRSGGIAVISPSGGTIAVTADRLASAGLELASLTAETRAALSQIVPASRAFNPLDVGGLPREHGLSAAIHAQAVLAKDPTVGVVFIVVATTPQLEEKARQWGEAAIGGGTPAAILFTPGSLVDAARDALRKIGCPYTDRMDDALRVMRAATTYGQIVSTSDDGSPPRPDLSAIEECTATLPEGPLTEHETKSLLRAAGMAVTAETLAANAEDAVRAAHGLGYPVVLKASCRALIHKSDAGAVVLGLENDAQLRNAWQEVSTRVTKLLPELPFEGCLVQEMRSGGTEMIIGARWDPQFGGVVLVGAGGIFVEIVSDIALALAPLTHARALALLRTLKVWPILIGARGRPAADVNALADALVRLSWIAYSVGPRLTELDVNPLLVQTSGAIALDARATLAHA